MKRFAIRCHWFLSTQLGLDPLRLLRSLRSLPAFLADWRRFRQGYRGPLQLVPCLQDRHEPGGSAEGEYFWQDLLVARAIHAAVPRRHLDVGSRVDGFVAHVACFREIEVFDVRPVAVQVPGVIFRQADLMQRPAPGEPDPWRACCDSLSCLHALEHFGLGRYGDPIDPQGYRRGLERLASLLEPGGTLYLSVPLGRQRVAFNANWIFDPHHIIDLARSHALDLCSLTLIHAGGSLQQMALPVADQLSLAVDSSTLGLFVFERQLSCT
ncbi:MAG: DUF268 domain-containing protein [Synechococcaceae cyanobacterium]|nr:DUF268 domain-containing protein [Synechococcaceae cyanobacterium]